MAYQPIVSLKSGVIVGVEALARFSLPPQRTPDRWFAEAGEIGLGTELQLMAVSRALPALDQLPDDVYVSVNVDPTTASSMLLAEIVEPWPAGRVVIELTEHAPASDYPALRDALDSYRRSGVRIAVDDAGAGFASLKHILELSPDIIKLDISIVRDVDTEASHRALASALVGFAREMNTELIAEGVETVGEALALDALGIRLMQGYYLARPGPISDLFDMLKNPIPVIGT
jgi:EAL domain-containing protein (putative c-di-GMP-specific phosphodiesterase class I)